MMLARRSMKCKMMKKLKLDDFDYQLTRESIAQEPISPRSVSGLFVYDRKNKKTSYKKFYEIVDQLNSGDVLVLNDTRVMPARIIARKITPEGKPGRQYKVLLVKKIANDTWECLIEGKKRRIGQRLYFNRFLQGEIIDWQRGYWTIKFNKKGRELDTTLFTLGELPIPPYIKKNPKPQAPNPKQGEGEPYQTVYAEKLGSVAAPTAGFHFTKELLTKIRKKV